MIPRMITRSMAARLAGRLPIFKVLAVAQVALLARNHLRHLSSEDRHRMADLVRQGRSMTQADRAELRALVSKLDGGAFLANAADRLSPVPLPGRFTKGGKRRAT